MAHPKNAGIFNVPLDYRQEALNLPDYLKIVEVPMDFSTIKARVLNGLYTSKSSFIADIRLIFQNAKRYSHTYTHTYYKRGLLAG